VLYRAPELRHHTSAEGRTDKGEQGLGSRAIGALRPSVAGARRIKIAAAPLSPPLSFVLSLEAGASRCRCRWCSCCCCCSQRVCVVRALSSLPHSFVFVFGTGGCVRCVLRAGCAARRLRSYCCAAAGHVGGSGSRAARSVPVAFVVSYLFLLRGCFVLGGFSLSAGTRSKRKARSNAHFAHVPVLCESHYYLYCNSTLVVVVFVVQLLCSLAVAKSW